MPAWPIHKNCCGPHVDRAAACSQTYWPTTISIHEVYFKCCSRRSCRQMWCRITPPSPHRHACSSDTRDVAPSARQLQPASCVLAQRVACVARIKALYCVYATCRRSPLLTFCHSSIDLYLETCALRHHLQPTRDVICSPPVTSGGRPATGSHSVLCPVLVCCSSYSSNVTTFDEVPFSDCTRFLRHYASTYTIRVAYVHGQPDRYTWPEEFPPPTTCKSEPIHVSASKMTS